MKHIHYLNNNIRKKHMYLKQHYCHLQKLIKMCTTSLVRFEKCKHHFEFPLWCSKHRTYHQLSEGNKCMSLKKILGASCYFTTSKIQKTKRSKEFWSPHSYDIGHRWPLQYYFQRKREMELPPPKNSTRSSLSHEC